MAAETRQLLENLRDEQNGAALYRSLAAAETDPRMAELYRRFAEVEDRHAAVFAAKLQQAGVTVKPFRPSWRTSVLAWLARRLGVRGVLPTIVGIEQSAARDYARQPDAASLAPDEASHARLLRAAAGNDRPGLQGSQVARIEGRHRGAAGGGNALRAAVLGANDGLVSNLSLVMGVAGAQLAGQNILITGLAGLLAGACSMALGEWLSVQSSRELYQRQIDIERQEIATAPREEAEELALIYMSRGVAEPQARQMAEQIIANHDSALDTLTREELGIDPDELGGSAWVAAGTSFVLFAAGAVVPVVPFLFLGGRAAIATSAGASTLALFAIGGIITLFTGRPVWRSGLRMVLFGLAAAAITFTLGRLIGAAIT